jgi:RsiW-degrading membrane proteinase PrsW (M82 family)
MAEEWYYVVNGQRRGPVDSAALAALAREGVLERSSLVWREGLSDWTPASNVSELFPASAPSPPPLPRASDPSKKGFLGGIGARISTASELPTISGMPVREILIGGLQKRTRDEDIEEEFIVGTRSTTPNLSTVDTAWPTPRVFWRIMAGALATYFLLYLGITQFGNSNFVPGLIVIGSFVVPFSVVVLFFELNVPKNVSIYQVGKMLMLGGALSLIATMFLFDFIPGSGVGAIIPALLTGVIEETGKALALLIVAFSARYRFQLNGLLFGAAVGAGFAGFESAGYALNAAFDGGMDAAIDSITLRALLSPGGHVIWTAMVGSAIWRVKKDAAFRLDMLLHRDVLRRWGIAVVLHGLWDSDLYVHPYVQLGILVVVGWYIVLAILKQGLEEVAEAKKAVGAAA